jgi:hypothetical protein
MRNNQADGRRIARSRTSSGVQEPSIAWAKSKRITMERVRDIVGRQGGGMKEVVKRRR